MSMWTIHIGPGKTGTTFLQDVLLGRCDQIIAAGRPNNQTREYQAFFRALTRDEDEPAAVAAIGQFVAMQTARAAGKPIVLSDETLALAPMWCSVALRLREVVPQAKILLIIRNQLTAIPSYYANHGRALMDVPEPYRGRFVGFDAWFKLAVQDDCCDYVKAIDYRALASTFLRYFPDRVHVLTYESMVRDRAGFGEQFSTLIGADVRSLLASSKRVNPRQTNRALGYQRLRSRFLPAVHFSKWLPGLKPIAERFLKGGASIQVQLSGAQANAVRSRYAAGNAWIEQHFGIDLRRHDYPL